jgi:hypothetical protein
LSVYWGVQIGLRESCECRLGYAQIVASWTESVNQAKCKCLRVSCECVLGCVQVCITPRVVARKCALDDLQIVGS